MAELVKEAPPSYDDVVGNNAGIPPYNPGSRPPTSEQPQGAPYPRAPYPTQTSTPYPVHTQGYPAATTSYQESHRATNVTIVSQPHGAAGRGRLTIKPNNYMAMSFISMLCCCWLFGLVALLHSIQVDSAWNRGDVQAAQHSSHLAKRWNIIAIVSGVVLGILVAVVVGGFRVFTSVAFNEPN